MGIWSKLREWWAELQERRTGPQASVGCDDDGVTLTIISVKRRVNIQLRWDQITAVCECKRDCFAYDQINLIFSTNDEHEWMQVTEEYQGYKELLGELPHRLPGFPAEDRWFARVAFPAFEANWTELYRRGAPTSGS